MTQRKMPGQMLALLLAICALTFGLAGTLTAADKPKSASLLIRASTTSGPPTHPFTWVPKPAKPAMRTSSRILRPLPTS